MTPVNDEIKYIEWKELRGKKLLILIGTDKSVNGGDESCTVMLGFDPESGNTYLLNHFYGGEVDRAMILPSLWWRFWTYIRRMLRRK